MSELSKWISHKIVEAGKIFAAGPDYIMVESAAGGPIQFTVPSNFFARGTPELGDYFVRYEDGYMSWSPAKAFEEGYSKV